MNNCFKKAFYEKKLESRSAREAKTVEKVLVPCLRLVFTFFS